MPADPGANLGKQKMPTEEKDIGHVAPSFENPKFYNSLVVRPEYRISLKLGNINDLFLHDETTLKGKMERMQVAALYYFPMNHNKAVDAVNFGWKYYKETILDEHSDATALQKLSERIQNFVVDGGELPPPAEDPAKPKAENFKKIRFPGSGLCTTNEKHIPSANCSVEQVQPRMVRDESNPKLNAVNNVDIDMEMADMAKNQIDFDLISTALRLEYQRLRMAIRGQ